VPVNVTTAENGTVRERILSAALKLFVEKSFHGTSIPDIVAASGTSIGAVYHHFGSKEELAHVLHRQLVDQFVEMSAHEVLSLPDTRSRVRGYVAMMFRLTEEAPEFVSYLIYTRPKSVVEDNLTVCSREGLEVTQRIISDGKKAGEMRDIDDRVLCGLISGTIMRLLDLRLDGVIAEPLTAIVADTAESIWAGIRA
jgi:AcrR family transcriptional regulator